MPFGVRDVLAILLVGGLGCQRKRGDAEVGAVGSGFCIATEEADEGYFVLVHDCLRLLNLPILVGAPLSEWAMLPSAEALHLRRLRRNLFGGFSGQELEGNRNPKGGAAEAEERAAAGRMKRPEAVPEQRRDTKRQTVFRAKVSSARWLRKATTVGAGSELACPSHERCGSSPPLHLGALSFTRPPMHRDTWGRPAGLAAEMDIV